MILGVRVYARGTGSVEDFPYKVIFQKEGNKIIRQEFQLYICTQVLLKIFQKLFYITLF